MSTVHIESNKEDIANIVLMPGDPKRSEYIAKKFLTNVKLVNTIRGMYAFTGYYKNKRLTVFPSGMGNPSMGIYSYELFTEYDVKNIIRIGSCGGYVDKLKLNDVILVNKSVSESSYARLLDNSLHKSIKSSIELNNNIILTANENNFELIKGDIYCSDVFYEKDNDYQKKAKSLEVIGVEMETFALFNNARLCNKNASALLTVSDSFCYPEKLSSKEREQGLDKMIILALESCLKIEN